MRLLLDSHAFLWFIGDSPQLSRKARRLLEDEDNEILLSLASVWEIAIKQRIGKLDIPGPLNTFLATQLAANGIATLGIDFRHACRVALLPVHHRDPFDRLLISQCLEDELPIVSADAAFDSYDIKRIW